MKRIFGKPKEELNRLTTEQTNRASTDLDLKSSLEIVRVINNEDAKVVDAVRGALPQIGRAVGLIANALQKGGRLIYVGAGTSGRIAALDAAECPPTFNVDPRMVQFVMAGGPAALASALEADEDSRELGNARWRKGSRGGTMWSWESRPADALRSQSRRSNMPRAKARKRYPSLAIATRLCNGRRI